MRQFIARICFTPLFCFMTRGSNLWCEDKTTVEEKTPKFRKWAIFQIKRLLFFFSSSQSHTMLSQLIYSTSFREIQFRCWIAIRLEAINGSCRAAAWSCVMAKLVISWCFVRVMFQQIFKRSFAALIEQSCNWGMYYMVFN